MAEDIFVDSLVDIAITGGLARLDFANLATINSANGEPPTLQPSRRVIMPLEGFLKAHQAMGRMIDIMIEKGTLTKQIVANGGAGTKAPG